MNTTDNIAIDPSNVDMLHDALIKVACDHGGKEEFHAAVQRWAAEVMQQQRAPEGWVLVPREPTIPMRCAGELTKAPISCWFAMVDAAPKPPEPKPAQECGACDKPGEHCSNVYGICTRHGGNPSQSAPPPAKPVCSACNDRGEIGGFVNAESGYQTDPCPHCTAKSDDGRREGLIAARTMLEQQDTYPQLSGTDAGLLMADSQKELLNAYRDHMIDMISAEIEKQSSRLEFYVVVTDFDSKQGPRISASARVRSDIEHLATMPGARVARVIVESDATGDRDKL